MQNIIVYDLETKKTFEEVGGIDTRNQSNHHLLEVSFLGLYSFSQEKYFGFFEKDLSVLEKILLKEKPLVVGFNSISFDNRVLQPYFKSLDISTLPQLDILDVIYKSLGFRIKLDNVARATLGYGKSGSGLDAIKYFRTGDLKSLSKYCMDDVKITKEIYEYGIKHGQLLFPTGGEIRPVKINWGTPPFIRDIVAEAASKHLQLKMKYWIEVEGKNEPEIRETTVEIKEIHGQDFIGFDNTTHEEKKFNIGHIMSCEITDTQFAHQSSLI